MNTAHPSIDTVWSRITAHSGSTFRTIKGIEFSYEARGGYIKLLNTNRCVPRSNFETALGLSPLQSVTQLQRANIQGPSYVLAILRDPRITGQLGLNPAH